MRTVSEHSLGLQCAFMTRGDHASSHTVAKTAAEPAHNGRPCKQQVLWQRFCARCTISISMCCGRYDRKIVLSDLQGESKASRVRMAGPWFSQMLMIYLPTAGSTTPKPPECYSSGRGKKFLKVPVEAQEMTCQRRKGWREHLLDLSGKEVCCGILAAFQLARQKNKDLLYFVRSPAATYIL